MTEDDRLLLHAMLDGELDAPTQRTVERRLQSEPDLANAYGSLRTLQGAMRALPVERPSQALRDLIDTLPMRRRSAFNEPVVPRRAAARRPFSGWNLMAASVAALLIGATGGWISGQTRGPSIENGLVASHVRGLIASRPFDVASSDRHTVRPWFAGKLAIAPFVADIAPAGFTLEGGRIDVIDGKPEPTLVYRRGPHVISMTRLQKKALSLGAEHSAIAGLAVLRWHTDDADYVAVSDAAPSELDALRTAFDAAMPARGTAPRE